MPETKSYRFDRFVVDLRSASLRRDGIVLPLRPKTFDVLVYLVRNPGRLIAKDELIENVWQNVIVTENSLVQCIMEIRQALGDGAQAIETVAKRGYLLSASVVEVDQPKPPEAPPADAETDSKSSAPPLPERPSIAVLPFDNMSDDPDQEYFADGISEDLITGLSRVHWLFVIARNSSFAYKSARST